MRKRKKLFRVTRFLLILIRKRKLLFRKRKLLIRKKKLYEETVFV